MISNKEAIKYLIPPVATSTEPSAEYLKQKAAYDLATKALEFTDDFFHQSFRSYVNGVFGNCKEEGAE